MTTKHTPGPWHIGMRSGHNANTVYAYDGKDQHCDTPICAVSGVWLHKSIDEVQECAGIANACLISSAPCLLRELQAALEYIPETMHGPARAAIAKATGQEPT